MSSYDYDETRNEHRAFIYCKYSKIPDPTKRPKLLLKADAVFNIVYQNRWRGHCEWVENVPECYIGRDYNTVSSAYRDLFEIATTDGINVKRLFYTGKSNNLPVSTHKDTIEYETSHEDVPRKRKINPEATTSGVKRSRLIENEQLDHAHTLLLKARYMTRVIPSVRLTVLHALKCVQRELSYRNPSLFDFTEDDATNPTEDDDHADPAEDDAAEPFAGFQVHPFPVSSAERPTTQMAMLNTERRMVVYQTACDN